MALFGRGNELDNLIKRLESKGYHGPREKREVLAQLAERAGEVRPEVLVRFLTSGDSDLGRFALDRLGPDAERGLLEQLLKALERTPRGRWRPVIAGVHRLASPELGERLGQMLRARKIDVREAALDVIGGDTDPKRHLGLLKRALRDEETVVRVRAVRLLGGEVADETIRGLVRELMYADDEAVRETAIEVLAKNPHSDLIEDFFDLLPNVASRLQDEILRGLRRMLAAHDKLPEAVLERLLPLLAADDQRIRKAAAELLASARDKLAVLRRFCRYAKGIAFWLRDRAFEAISGVADNLTETVLTLLADEDLDVVVGAINMIGESRDARLVDGLGGLLDGDRDWWIKIPALEKLSLFPQPEVTQILLWKLDDEDLRTAALAALGRRGDKKTLPDVLRFMDHPRRGVRRSALSSLEGFRDPLVMQAYEQIARSDPDSECRLVALEGLESYGEEGSAIADAIRKEFQSTDRDVAAGTSLTMLSSSRLDDAG